MTDHDAVMALVDRWDRQQEGYIEQREERFDVMFEVLEHALGIDAACGPGSLSLRLLKRFRSAKVIAIDADVMLLECARVALAAHTDRVRLVEADLSQSSWAEHAINAVKSLGADRPEALVSTTALHWLRPGELAEFYGAAGELLAPGGIVLNGDHMRFDGRWPTLAKVARSTRDRVERAAVANGEDDWPSWWEKAASIPRLAPLKARRDAFYKARPPKRATSSEEDCSVDFHVASLRHAGFSEVGTAWQKFDNYVVFGRKPT